MGLFDFFDMADNYKERKVANYSKDGIVIDTCAVSDSDKPFETGVAHPQYNDGDWVIVQLYNTKKEAKKGHDKWADIMVNNPPQQLKDVSTCAIANMLKDADESLVYKRQD